MAYLRATPLHPAGCRRRGNAESCSKAVTEAEQYPRCVGRGTWTGRLAVQVIIAAAATALVVGPQRNGLAESFLDAFRRDHLGRTDRSDATILVAPPPTAFEHFDEMPPHPCLQTRSPRESRRRQDLKSASTSSVSGNTRARPGPACTSTPSRRRCVLRRRQAHRTILHCNMPGGVRLAMRAVAACVVSRGSMPTRTGNARAVRHVERVFPVPVAASGSGLGSSDPPCRVRRRPSDDLCRRTPIKVL